MLVRCQPPLLGNVRMESCSVTFRDRDYFVTPRMAKAFGQHLIFINEIAWHLDGSPCVAHAIVDGVLNDLIDISRKYNEETKSFDMSDEEEEQLAQRLRNTLVKWISDASALCGAFQYLSSEFNSYVAAERRDHPEDAR